MDVLPETLDRLELIGLLPGGRNARERCVASALERMLEAWSLGEALPRYGIDYDP